MRLGGVTGHDGQPSSELAFQCRWSDLDAQRLSTKGAASSRSFLPSFRRGKWHMLLVADAFLILFCELHATPHLPPALPRPLPFPCSTQPALCSLLTLSTSLCTPGSHRSTLCSPCTCGACHLLRCLLGVSVFVSMCVSLGLPRRQRCCLLCT